MIWRFQIYNLFFEILKSRRSKTEFRDKIYIFCEKKIIYLVSPDHVLQNDT